MHLGKSASGDLTLWKKLKGRWVYKMLVITLYDIVLIGKLWKSLLYNTADKDITKLQRVQNLLARVVTYSRFLTQCCFWNHCIGSLLIIALFSRSVQEPTKHCHLHKPSYLNSTVTPARHPRQLQSINSNPLHIAWVKTKAGTRAFSVAAPTLELASCQFYLFIMVLSLNAAYPP